MTQRFFPAIGGAEKAIENLLDYLSEKHDVTVYTTNALDLNSFWDTSAKTIKSYTDKNYKVQRYEILVPSNVPQSLYSFSLSIASPGPFCPEMWNDLLQINKNFDVIIATAFPYNHIIPAFVASKKHHVPLITIPHMHLEFPEHYLKAMWITVLAESEIVVVNTLAEKQALLNYNISSNKIHVIPPGIELEKNKVNYSNLKKKLNINENSLTVLFAGTKLHEKGVFFLIESMKPLWDKSMDLELVVIGSSTASYEKYIKDQENKYLTHIHDLGLVSDEEKEEAFNSCDIFAMPSKSESFGITYLEAWRYKKPVIGCNIEAVMDLIDDKVNGFLVEFDNIRQLSECIEKLASSELRIRLGEEGFTKLSEKFNAKKLYAQFEELCLSVTK